MQRKAGCASHAQKSPWFGQMCKRCAESVQPLSYIKKERQILRFDVQNLVHLQGLEPWAHWLREQAADSSQFLEVSICRSFQSKQRNFSPWIFRTLCRILHRKAPSARFETVQNPCRNRALTLRQIKNILSTTDLTALVWVANTKIKSRRILLWSMPGLCWVGRWSIIFPLAVTMADWKIKF